MKNLKYSSVGLFVWVPRLRYRLNFPDHAVPELAHLMLYFLMCSMSCVLMVTEICLSCGRSRAMGEGVAVGDCGIHTPESPRAGH
jgi:hypothetical protein